MIDRTPLHRPRVSRETRQLLVTALLAVIALLVLGRIRSAEEPAAPNPVPALLTQFGARTALAELAFESAEVRGRIGRSLLAVPVDGGSVAAFRLRSDTAVALIPRSAGSAGGPGHGSSVPGAIAADPATGLTLVRVADAAPALVPATWTPGQSREPRYLFATVAARDAVVLRPAFVAALDPVPSPAWSGPVWRVPEDTGLAPGSWLFTADAALAGLVVRDPDGLAVVPGSTLLADARRLQQMPPRIAGRLGVDVQVLTPALAEATGARTGMVVAWVDSDGPAAGQLAPGDVIEAIDGRWLESRHQWDVRIARLAAGEPVVLGVRRRGEWRDVQLVAAPPPEGPPPLGLTLLRIDNVGSQVIAVERGSAAAAAGLAPGDIITLIGTIEAPGPAQIRSAFAAERDRPLLVAISRGTSSRVLTLPPR